MKNRYRIVKIPSELANQIDEIVKEGKGGYTSRTEFVKEAVRRLIAEQKPRIMVVQEA